MRPFAYNRAESAQQAVSMAATPASGARTASETQFLAGGTTLLDLMKLDSMSARTVVDINDLREPHGAIKAGPDGLQLGALVRMSEAAEHPAVLHDYPVIAQSLQLAASQQIRNMASLGGNVLQRTRCQYFRDPSWTACNKRVPGSGCAAIDGVNRMHAVLGVSDRCIASYPGDFAQALTALDAIVQIRGARGFRTLRMEDLHRLPGDTPHVETVLAPGDLITGFLVPAGPWTRRSLYLKIRDRQSYEFGVATAAVALSMTGNVVDQARIALGGVAVKPWRAHEAEASLVGQPLTVASARTAADRAFAGAVTHGGNDFKPDLGRRTLVRALLQAGRMEV